MNDCIPKIIKASGLTKEQATKILVDVNNTFKAGSEINPDDLFAAIDDISKARKEKIKKIRYSNGLRDFTTRAELSSRIIDEASKIKPIKILGGLISNNPIENSFKRVIDSYEYMRRSRQAGYRGMLEKDLTDNDLFEYVKDKTNDAAIAQEVAAQMVIKDTPKASVTGNDQAFKAGKSLANVYKSLLADKQSVGSTAGFLEGRISANMWDQAKVVRMSDDEFYNLVKDVKWNGNIAEKQQWIDLKNDISSGNYVDPEWDLNFGSMKNPELSSIMAQKGSLAEFSGQSRSIHLDTAQYIALANKVFKGDSVFERVLLEIDRDSNLISNLDFWGSKPSEQYDKVLNDVIAKTKTNKEYLRSDGKHVLQNDYYYGSGERPGSLKSVMFNYAGTDNRQLAQAGATIRAWEVMLRLGGGFLSQQLDTVSRALNVTLTKGEGNLFGEVLQTYKDFGSTVGEANMKIVKAEYMGYATGLGDLIDDLTATYRYSGIEPSPDSKGILKNLENFANNVSKFNGIDWWNKKSQLNSYIRASGVFAELGDTTLEALPEYSRSQLALHGITSKEWDFIRTNAIEENFRGEKTLSTKMIQSLDSEKFKELNPDVKSKYGLEKLQKDLQVKWNSFLWKEANSSTPTPGITDSASLHFGTRAGTVTGEIARFAQQFRSFSFSYARKLLIPMIRYGDKSTVFQYVGAIVPMIMLKQTVQDLAMGKTPRDFTRPENLSAVLLQAFGFPVIDSIAPQFFSDNPTKSGFADVLVGPAFTDGLGTLATTSQVVSKLIHGEADINDIGKAATKTVVPSIFPKNYPLLSPVYNTLIYNNLMDSFDSGYTERLKTNLKDRGQAFWLGP